MPRPPKPLDPGASAAALFGYLLRERRQERTQAGLAKHLGVSNGYISQLERATELPSRQIAEALDSWYETEVFTAAWEAIQREHEQKQEREQTARERDQELAALIDAARAGSIVAGSSRSNVQEGVGSVPPRRAILEALGALGISAALPSWLLPRRRVVEALDVTRQDGVATLTKGATDDLASLVDHYIQAFRGTSPAALYDDVLAVRMWASDFLGAPHVSRDLLATVGWLSALLSLIVYDLGDIGAARVWAGDAERRGEAASHPEIQGWPYQFRSMAAFYAGDANASLRAARQGQAVAPLGTAEHAKLAGSEMRALARLGRKGEALDALRHHDEATQAIPAEWPTRGAFSIDRDVGLRSHKVTSLLLLGDLETAVALAREELAYNGGRNPTSYAIVQTDLGLALAGLGRLDEAHATGMAALDTPRLVACVLARAGELDAALQRRYPQTTEARDFHERYITVRREVEQKSITST